MEGHTVEDIWMVKRRGDGQMDERAEPVFVNILRSPGIDSQPGGIVYKYRLSWINDSWADTQEIYTIVQPPIGYFEAAPSCKKLSFTLGKYYQ
jgi:hypothetical protein